MRLTVWQIGMRQHCNGAACPTITLRDEHEVILRALSLLERYGKSLEAGERVDSDSLRWLVDFFSTFADRYHSRKEERHLIPALECHGLPRAGGLLRAVSCEHEGSRELLGAMSRRSEDLSAEMIRSYVTLERRHIEKENDVLFPLAERLLSGRDGWRLAHAFEEMERRAAVADIHQRLLPELARLEAQEGRVG